MTSKIKHLQFVRLYLSTHVTNTKSMTPNQLRHRASGFKGFRHTPLGPCSGFKAKCHDFIFLFLLFFFFFFSFLEDTKSMTPNQLRHRASGFKGFRHTPLGPCSGFKAKCHDFIFLFLLFFFFFFSFLEDNIGLQLWVTQNYLRLSTYLRPALQSERRYTNS